MTNYGVVVDLGLLGSRIQIYQWNLEPSSPPGLPVITHEADWQLKILPGVSSFADKPQKVWKDHYKQLMEYAGARIPQAAHSSTPVFVLATAGMRLLPEGKRTKLTQEICHLLKEETGFLLGDCQDHVQVIDGETEGLYGWLALNYLMKLFEKDGETIGFMDMGGALTQIAFAPSDEAEVERHNDDISTVSLRYTDGSSHRWRVFVETWLGFGANMARKTYLTQLIAESTEKAYDACMPKGASTVFEGVTVEGVGNYEMCLKMIYPMLKKHIPCKDEPCLFNGVHTPNLDFDKDKLVGVSEYWYTANDVFGLGGEYNFHLFNQRVKDYCESDWSQILNNLEDGQYNGLDADKFLLVACFKALWVLNILHEGFNLPRIGVDISESDAGAADEEIAKVQVPFLLAQLVDGDEISWTLGKTLLYALLQISASDRVSVDDQLAVGIYPSKLSGGRFISGGGELVTVSVVPESLLMLWFPFVILVAAVAIFIRRYPRTVQRTVSRLKHVVDRLRRHVKGFSLDQHEHELISLEEGNFRPQQLAHSLPMLGPQLAFLRTRLNLSLLDEGGQAPSPRAPSTPRMGLAVFMLRPFPRSGLMFQLANNLKESLRQE